MTKLPVFSGSELAVYMVAALTSGVVAHLASHGGPAARTATGKQSTRRNLAA